VFVPDEIECFVPGKVLKNDASGILVETDMGQVSFTVQSSFQCDSCSPEYFFLPRVLRDSRAFRLEGEDIPYRLVALCSLFGCFVRAMYIFQY